MCRLENLHEKKLLALHVHSSEDGKDKDMWLASVFGECPLRLCEHFQNSKFLCSRLALQKRWFLVGN